MFKNVLSSLVLAIFFSIVSAQFALADSYGAVLSKCIIDSTTPEDRNDFVMWMFSAMAQHPSVKNEAKISNEMVETATLKTAKVFERLLAEDCRTETANVIKYEGTAELENSFRLLGQVAAKELFQDPNVAQSLAKLEQYMNVKKLEDALRP